MITLSSGWGTLENRVFRVGNVKDDSFELEGVDTSDDIAFPAGKAAGTYRLASDWTEIDQVAAVATSGGDQQYATWQYINEKGGRQYQRRTVKNAKTMTLTLDYDPDKPWYAALTAADQSGLPAVLRVILPNGDGLYYPVDPSFDPDPTQTGNQNMQNTASFALAGPHTRVKDAV